MNIPAFKPDRVLALLEAFRTSAGAEETLEDLRASLAAITDPQKYLRGVAESERGASAILKFALIGLALTGAVPEAQRILRDAARAGRRTP